MYVCMYVCMHACQYACQPSILPASLPLCLYNVCMCMFMCMFVVFKSVSLHLYVTYPNTQKGAIVQYMCAMRTLDKILS